MKWSELPFFSWSDVSLSSKRLFERMVQSGGDDDIVLDMLHPARPISWKNVVLFALNNTAVNDFFETNTLLNQEWSQRLSGINTTSFPLHSISGETISVFSQFKAAYFWKCYRNLRQAGQQHTEEGQALLAHACELGSYNAQIERLNGLMDNLIEAIGDTETLTEFIEGSLKLADRYWTSGSLCAGIYFIGLADYCKKNHDDSNCFLALETALRCFFRGFYLSDHPTSTALADVFYPEDGWLGVFTQYSEFTHWHSAEDAVAHLKGILLENYQVDYVDVILLDRMQKAREEVNAILTRFPSSLCRGAPRPHPE